ncbi:Alpha-cuprenene synthase COP6 [Colletotrichum sidae]|uniref:Alpha-cuprenene synthase COP6 n=2 Tax=Colletotrichum orbiculare species complex TaxID=2707354 RepID=A0A4R8PVU3_9PEZI|nr:Alpha-cuprenene synthase COP6 [Colletotrichum spinosum]TEA13726.1 Alpha-cuprenene synthase COP6 [Colletotrichum sidae]
MVIVKTSLGAHSASSSTTTTWLRVLSSLWSLFSPKRIRLDDDLAQNPSRLASAVRPVCARLLEHLNYPGAPVLKAEAVEALLEYMYKRAVEMGVPLDTPISAKGFRLGYAEGLLAHPRHPTIVQGYVGLFTWLVVQYDDIVGQNDQMVEEAMVFHQRFFKGERQLNNLLEGIATLLREAHDLFDPVMANMLQLSVLKFLTSNLLERHEGFQKLKVTRAGEKFPDFYRDLSGMNVAYAVFCYPKEQYPDVSQFLEAIPDMAKFIDISNDVLSYVLHALIQPTFGFYKEELGGDTRNYMHNRALTSGKPVLAVLEEVNADTIASAKRVSAILKGRGVYEDSWNESVRGYMAMHTTNVRYKLKDLGLGEEHPLAPFEHRIGELFDRMKA